MFFCVKKKSKNVRLACHLVLEIDSAWSKSKFLSNGFQVKNGPNSGPGVHLDHSEGRGLLMEVGVRGVGRGSRLCAVQHAGQGGVCHGTRGWDREDSTGSGRQVPGKGSSR